MQTLPAATALGGAMARRADPRRLFGLTCMPANLTAPGLEELYLGPPLRESKPLQAHLHPSRA